ncbi:enoyl-CoA hydratase-related protein [Rhodococcus wratislaviensis]|uniref:Putative enoyl-CoA hydratase n=1 Tax=Rhodococcus wratislaviensis NBRC 100605 TaxID=1219028 RepID=X0QFG3_RHOWR|nr:enoyl-CoA hydratase-related protein [Rhodococcus wratislaviensis]GAF50322.1 putative enoyl-CoA hydratase [Rhodococcus wratislaviensis NBRC 100605]
MTTSVRFDVRSNVGWITLDGVDTRNSLDRNSAQALVEACDAVDGDPSVGAVVITGAGSAFCSGADRAALRDLASAQPHEAYEVLDSLYRAFRRFGEMTVPSIAAVNGAAVGAGLNLALAADVRLAAEDALLVPGFAENEIHPGGGHFHLLERAVGRQAAAALGVFGRRLTGTSAADIGLVWEAVPVSDLEEAAQGLAEPVARDPELARALAKSLRLTTAPPSAWQSAIEVERARQMWSLSRPRPVGAVDR